MISTLKNRPILSSRNNIVNIDDANKIKPLIDTNTVTDILNLAPSNGNQKSALIIDK